jgi:alpha-glucosidase
VASRFGLERADLLNTLLMTLPGASVNYLGEEIGMTDICVEYPEPSKEPVLCTNSSAPHTFTRDFCRSPFQWNSGTNAGFTNGSTTWLPVATNYQTVNVAKELDVLPTSHLKLYKALIQLRQNELFVNGKLDLRALSDNVLAYTR